MDKVYIVTQGSYSDYRIVGVFDTKERAELFIESFYGRIEVYDLNPHEEKLSNGYKSYRVYMDEKGSTEEYGVSVGNGKSDDCWFADYNQVDGVVIVCNVWAKDEKHAIKITNEKRIQHIANNTWGNKIENGRY